MFSARVYSFLVLAAFAFAGCRDIPEYPSAPQISLQEVKQSVVDFNGQPTDKLDFVVKFTDGDGDLGLGTNGSDIAPPYQYCQQPFNSDSICDVVNPNYNNWRMKFLIKQADGQFVPHPFIADSYSGRFPRLEPAEGEPGPLDGTITYTVRLEQLFFPANQAAKFQIQILDRNFNLSNTIETGEIILNAD